MSCLYAGYALGVMLLWGAASWNGWELFSAHKGKIPQTVRQSAGGYRSYTFWRGGK